MHILAKIEKVCREFPTKTAVSSGSESITYEELWEKSECAASWLSENYERGKPVVVHGGKSVYLIVAYLACAKAGNAYCPVDISMPEERLAEIVERLSDPLVLTAARVREICENSAALPEERQRALWNGEDDTHYIIFTSGSTGKPKGVEVTSGNLSAFTDWSAGCFPEDVPIMNQAAFSFDLSVMDVYSALVTGHTLCCVDGSVQADAGAAVNFIRDEAVGYIVSTPSFANVLLSDRSFNHSEVPSLRGFRFCGEVLTPKAVRELFARFPSLSVFNTYGPTEATVAVTGIEVSADMCDDPDGIPIGKGMGDSEVFVSDGELIIAGPQVAKGYYGDPEQTAGRFFCDEVYGRCLRSGDLGHEKDGMLYFGGRMDSQIKLHGYRIELGDVEANLAALDPVREAVVIADREDGEVKRLVGIVTLRDEVGIPQTAKESFELSRKLKAMLAERIPKYMVPKKIIPIEAMPLNTNKKIDRSRLGEML